MFQITEYLVNLSHVPKYRNLDLLCFDLKLDEILSNSKIEPVQLQYIMPSSSANERFIGQQKFWENYRLVPTIDN